MSATDTSNVTGYSLPATDVCTPLDVAGVQDVVRQARKNGTHLYPFSTGLNWGYGSNSPVTAGAILVDLSKMNRILNADQISLDNPVALIEPGVTQAQLWEFLQTRCPALTFNVTGAGRDTSILGNALDRGVGYFGPRKEDVFGLEIVTGTGAIIKTGFRRLGETSPLAHSHPYGLGPILDGLFFQGNFGIVTSACFRLLPRRPVEVAISMGLRNSALLAGFIDELARLKRDGVLTSVTHLGNKARSHSTLLFGFTRYMERQGLQGDAALRAAERALNMVASEEWVSLAAVTGNRGQVAAAIREIRARIGALASVKVVTETRLRFAAALLAPFTFHPVARAYAAAVDAVGPLHRLALGEPTDIPIDGLLWKFGATGLAAKNLDQSRCGLLFVNPALPLNGRFVSELVGELEKIAAQHRHTLYMTLNIETSSSMVAVINLLFDREQPEERGRAHRCADAMLDCIRARGLEPYRARADMMSSIISGDSPYWQTIRRLKQVFDPDDIIAPGRYNLTTPIDP
jgi:4-cresol dehydrogenase (hydroxylating)